MGTMGKTLEELQAMNDTQLKRACKALNLDIGLCTNKPSMIKMILAADPPTVETSAEPGTGDDSESANPHDDASEKDSTSDDAEESGVESGESKEDAEEIVVEEKDPKVLTINAERAEVNVIKDKKRQSKLRNL